MNRICFLLKLQGILHTICLDQHTLLISQRYAFRNPLRVLHLVIHRSSKIISLEKIKIQQNIGQSSSTSYEVQFSDVEFFRKIHSCSQAP